MLGVRSAAPRPSLLPGWALLAALLTASAGFLVGFPSGRLALLALVATVALIGATWCFLAAPHLALATAIPFLVGLPALKLFVSDSLAPTKDGLFLAAGLALIATAVGHRLDSPVLRGDRILLSALALFVLLYLLNPLSGHGAAWFHSTRLMVEPLIALLAAVFIPGDRTKVWRWSRNSLIVTCVPLALYGVVQQALGVDGLLALGYRYGDQVRQIDGRLRSFGTLDDAFTYAGVLTLGLALIVMSEARAWQKLALAAPVLVGLSAALVRTSLLLGVLLLAVWCFSRNLPAAAAVLLAIALAVGGLVLARAEGTETRTVTTANGPLTLNGRVAAWEAAVGDPEHWPLGRGPGAVGTGAQRAASGLEGRPDPPPGADISDSYRAVDSGYLAIVADVGLLGLALLFTVLARLGRHAWRAAHMGGRAGWTTLALLAVLAGDALTRSSFGAFPTAALAFLLIGASVADALREASPYRPRPARSATPTWSQSAQR